MLSLRSARERLGVTQDELEERSGVPRGTISRIERDITPDPRISTMRALADALGVPVDDLIHDGDATAVATTPREVAGPVKEVAGAASAARPAAKEVEGSGRKSRTSKTQPARSLVAQRGGSERVE